MAYIIYLPHTLQEIPHKEYLFRDELTILNNSKQLRTSYFIYLMISTVIASYKII